MSEMKAQEAQQRVGVCDQRAVEQSRLAEELTIKVIAYTLPPQPMCVPSSMLSVSMWPGSAGCATHGLNISLHHTPFH